MIKTPKNFFWNPMRADQRQPLTKARQRALDAFEIHLMLREYDVPEGSTISIHVELLERHPDYYGIYAQIGAWSSDGHWSSLDQGSRVHTLTLKEIRELLS